MQAAVCREDDIESIHRVSAAAPHRHATQRADTWACCAQEISMLANCQCKNITDYHAAVLRPGTTELMIVMELMACSVADLVSLALCLGRWLY